MMTPDQAPVVFTKQALQEIRLTISKKGIPQDYFLRVGVRGGGCGVTKIIGFDQRKTEDMEWEVDGIHVIMDKRHMMHLIGSRVSFYEDEEKRGFFFE